MVLHDNFVCAINKQFTKIRIQSKEMKRSFRKDYSSQNDFAYFGIYPRAIDTVVPDYLTGSIHQRRLQTFRRQPRR